MAGIETGKLPPWLARQLQSLLSQNGHAWLLHGPSGLGQYDLALELVQAWLCEQRTVAGACHACPSCHAITVRGHPDLCVLMPEVDMLERHWPLPEKAQTEIDDKKRKPSKEIRIDAMRGAIEFAQRTSAKGKGKAVFVYPAEMMNHVTANALLKTLEEPPGDTRFILATRSAHLLLPTIRSRCMSHAMVFPQPQDSIGWMVSQGIQAANAEVLLAASGDRPMDALAMAAGLDAQKWSLFPNAMQEGDVAFVRDWGVVELVEALHKLCHDQMAAWMGAPPRFFPETSLIRNCQFQRLSSWSKALTKAMESVDHPYNTGLMQEALVNQARLALHSAASRTP